MEIWQDKIRRLEAHGGEYELAPVLKINTLRMLMTGKAKDYFDLCEGDRDAPDAAKSYEGLLNKVMGLHQHEKIRHHRPEEHAERERPRGRWSNTRALGVQKWGRLEH